MRRIRGIDVGFLLKVAVGSRFSLAGVGVLKELAKLRNWLLRVSYQVQVQVQVQVEVEVREGRGGGGNRGGGGCGSGG